jgi:hypothetical protein
MEALKPLNTPPTLATSPEEALDTLDAAPHLSRSASQGNIESNALFVTGGVIAVFGLALAAAPEYSWHLTKIAQALATAGVESGTLIVGGLVLLGVGLLARQRTSVAIAMAHQGHEEDRSDFRLVADQLIAKLTQLSTSSLQVAEDVTSVAEVQQGFFHKLDGKDDLDQEHRSALFRLASSLDKLTAHFDERIHALDLQFRGGLDGVIQVVNQTRQLLEARIDASTSQASSKMSLDFPPRTPDDDLHVLVDLESPAPGISQAGGSGDTADFFGTTLDRLDEMVGGLDDPRPPGPLPGDQH